MKFALPSLLLALAACADVSVSTPASQNSFQPGTKAVNGTTVSRVGNKTIILGSID